MCAKHNVNCNTSWLNVYPLPNSTPNHDKSATIGPYKLNHALTINFNFVSVINNNYAAILTIIRGRRKFAYEALAVYSTTLIASSFVVASDWYHLTGSVQKVNSYILQSSCRGGMQRMIRSSNLTLHTQRTYTSYQYAHHYISTFSVGLPTYP